MCAKSSEKTTNGAKSDGNADAGKTPELHASEVALGRRAAVCVARPKARVLRPSFALTSWALR